MLLKLNPGVTKLNLYDIVHTPGVAADLSHIETKAKVQGFVGPDQVRQTKCTMLTNVTREIGFPFPI
jgi:malate dehydrogenase